MLNGPQMRTPSPVRRISRSQSPVTPVYAVVNEQSAFVGLTTPKVASSMNIGSIAKRVSIGKNNRQNIRPSRALSYVPSELKRATSIRPQSATFLHMNANKGHHGQLKTIHTNLKRQQGSRNLQTRRRKSRRQSRRNRH